ncbi:MAG: hypothetical protein EXR85_04340 [Xanthomonadales bacterium]|nr:hypothetical protein [Xanthomonadales bacterium]
MFAVIRHYHFDKKDSKELDRMVQDEFVPLIKKAKGFVRYYWLDTGAGEGGEKGSEPFSHAAAVPPRADPLRRSRRRRICIRAKSGCAECCVVTSIS